MNFFAKERTELHFLGIDFLAPYFQSVNPIAIVVLAPVFAWDVGPLGAARSRAEHAGQVRHWPDADERQLCHPWWWPGVCRTLGARVEPAVV